VHTNQGVSQKKFRPDLDQSEGACLEAGPVFGFEIFMSGLSL
jgi:hypothetical protein